MISTEICPFDDPEYLAEIADRVGKNFSDRRKEMSDPLLDGLTDDQRKLAIELDNLTIEEINAVQAETIKKAICEPCRRQNKPCRFPDI